MNKNSTGGTNHGFKRKGKHFVKYEQYREGLNFLYVKRRVLNDGISTKPLYL